MKKLYLFGFRCRVIYLIFSLYSLTNAACCLYYYYYYYDDDYNCDYAIIAAIFIAQAKKRITNAVTITNIENNSASPLLSEDKGDAPIPHSFVSLFSSFLFLSSSSIASINSANTFLNCAFLTSQATLSFANFFFSCSLVRILPAVISLSAMKL